MNTNSFMERGRGRGRGVANFVHSRPALRAGLSSHIEHVRYILIMSIASSTWSSTSGAYWTYTVSSTTNFNILGESVAYAMLVAFEFEYLGKSQVGLKTALQQETGFPGGVF
jgi:hypothetical protein